MALRGEGIVASEDYKCFDCGREIDKKQIERRIICPYCSSRVIIKSRPPVLKKIKAR